MKKIANKYFILDTTKKTGIKSMIGDVLLSVLAATYKFKMNLIRMVSGKKKYKVSVCAIFKNEAPYLKEWLEFNHIIGIEHFYLYNNNSEDDYLSVLQPYIDKGLVTLTQWPKNQAQMECYVHCISNFSAETQWLGFIDIDEFIVPKSTNTIYEFLQPFEKNRGAVKIYWKMFGTSGLLDRPFDSLVTEKFTVCWPKYYSVGKCFYNTNFSFSTTKGKNQILHHIFWSRFGKMDLPPVNAFDKVCLEQYNMVKAEEHPIQINHYFTKSYSEYAKKRSKGDVYFKDNPHDEEYFYIHENENTSVDYSAYKYLIKLKLAMEMKE